MITAQILSIVAVLTSWLWWPTLAISFEAMVLLQIVWCCRQNKMGIMVTQVIAVAAALLCIGAGIFELVVLKRATWCGIFYFNDANLDDDFTAYDDCKEQMFALLSFVTAALWLVSAGFAIFFVKSGRYAKREERLSQQQPQTVENENQDCEGEVPATTMVELSSIVPVEIPVAAATLIFIPPEVAQKVDEESLVATSQE